MFSNYLTTERQLLIGLILGVLFGYFFSDAAIQVSFLGKIFVKLLKVVALPLVAFSILNALVGLGSVENFKKLGVSTLLFYFTTSFLAFVITFVLCSMTNFTVSAIGPEVETMVPSADFVSMFIPDNVFAMFAKGNILQIILFCLVLGVLSLSLPDGPKKLFSTFIDLGQHFCFKAIAWLLVIAPIGIFSLVANTIATIDYRTIPQIAQLFFLLGAGLLLHSLGVLPFLAKVFGGFNGYKYLVSVKKPLLMAVSTASSNATLPISLEAAKNEGKVSDKVADFVLPLGATFNMDGSAIFQTLVYLCIASVAGISLSFSHYLVLVVIVIFSSVGVSGIPGGALAVTAFMFSYLGLPEHYLGVVILLDRFWDYPITAINVWGDLVAAKVLDARA